MKNQFGYIFTLVILISCSQKEEENKPVEWNTEKSIQMNQDFTEDEEIQIKGYLARQQSVKINETGSGLRYVVIQEGKGALAKSGQTAVVHYSVKLLDGTKIYETEASVSDLFLIDKSQVESGLQEGIKKMNIGAHYKLIMPSHLAHGLVGDLGKIPPLSPIVIDIQLENLK